MTSSATTTRTTSQSVDARHRPDTVGPMQMTDWKLELSRTWALQEVRTDDGAIHTHRLAGGATPIRVYSDPAGKRHLLVPGPGRPAEDVTAGPALRCRVHSLDFRDGAGPSTFLDVSCSDHRLFAVFDDLLASVLVEAASSGDPFRSALSKLEGWQDLLRRLAPLSHEREMGLFAELAVLELLTAGPGTLDPTVWRGPAREAKDIVLPDAWVEVKAVGAKSVSVTVNGLDQLADVAGSAGYLAVLTVVEDEDGRTLSSVADALAERTTDARGFADLLVKAGWLGSDEPRHWRVDAVDVTRAEVCPRLTPDAVGPMPAGVGVVRYQLDLSVVRSLGVPNPAAVLRSAGAGT